MKNIFLITIFIFGLTSFSYGAGSTENDSKKAPIRSLSGYPEFNNEGYITRHFEETPEAFPNPMKGFRAMSGGGIAGSFNLHFHEYSLIYKHYIKYTDLEETADDTAQKIIDWSNREWAGIEKKNIKILPLIIINYIEGHEQANSLHPDHNYWPKDIPQPSVVERWYTPQLHERLEKFVMKLGEAWDNDPRVAAVQIGLWGFWGEQHLLFLVDNNFEKGIIPLSMQKTLGDAFTKAFKNKKLFFRYPETFVNYNFGLTWDYFAHPVEHKPGATQQMIRRNDWKNNMFIGEVAYDKEAMLNQPGGSIYGTTPDETLRSNRYTDHIINYIKRMHATNLTWIDKYTHGDLSLKANTARIQKALGYRYVIRSAVYKETAVKGENMRFGFEVSNVGVAPFYYNWSVEVSLLDQNRNVVYKKNLNEDIRKWLPDETYTIIGDITIPNNLRDGVYFLALSILDPAGNLPSIRFANTNYFYGGRTPVGIIGVNAEPQSDFGKFDLLRFDRSLQYTVGNNNPANRTINREQGVRAAFDRWQANQGNGSTINIRTDSETIDGINQTVYTINGNHVNGGYAHAITSGNTATVNNLKRMRAFSFTILGDGNDYRVSLQTSDTWSAAGNWDNYHTVISTVKGGAINVIIFVDTLSQNGWHGKPTQFIQSNAHSFQFEPANYNGVGQFELKIWDIKTYQ